MHWMLLDQQMEVDVILTKFEWRLEGAAYIHPGTVDFRKLGIFCRPNLSKLAWNVLQAWWDRLYNRLWLATPNNHRGDAAKQGRSAKWRPVQAAQVTSAPICSHQTGSILCLSTTPNPTCSGTQRPALRWRHLNTFANQVWHHKRRRTCAMSRLVSYWVYWESVGDFMYPPQTQS